MLGLLLVGAAPANASSTQVSFTLEPGPLHLSAAGQVTDLRGMTGGWSYSTSVRQDVQTTSLL